MASALPKLKYYLLISVFLVIISMGLFCYTSAVNNNIDLLTFIGGLAGAFIPFGSTFTVIVSGIGEPVLLAFLTLLTGILSGIQIYLLVVIVANFIPLVDV